MRKRPKLLDPPFPCVVFLSERESERAEFQAAFGSDIKVLGARSQAALWSLLSKHVVHVVVVEHPLGGKSGGKVVAAALKKYPRIRRMLLSHGKGLSNLVYAMNEGVTTHCILKPWNQPRVKLAILRAVDDFQYEAEQEAWTERLSKAVRQLGDALRLRLEG